MMRRTLLRILPTLLALTGWRGVGLAKTPTRGFSVDQFGAVGDGVRDDTAAIQRAIEAAAAVGGGAQVRFTSGKTYLTGTLTLRGGIDFHLAGTSRLLVSTRREDYASAAPSSLQAAGIEGPGALLHAHGANDLTISGTGSIDGRSPDFMERFDPVDEWWIPKGFRPRLVVLENCERLTIRNITLLRAPSWTIHLLGCRKVLVEGLTIRNQPDVPNCDGIDPDHCQDVVIRDCHIVCGDDAIVVKATAGHDEYGPSRNIHVQDCVLETQDSGLKIGTETHQDIHDILFERCRIVTGCRGLCIQLRDSGSVYNIVFRDISFSARYFSAPWWGRGEAISFTAIPRTPQTRIGTIRNIRVENVRGTSENSIRIDALGGARISNVTLDNVALMIARSTAYPGGVFDNRPTMMVEQIERRGTPGISVRHADRVTLRQVQIAWGPNPPEYFTHLLEAEDAPHLDHAGLSGRSAHPERLPARVIR